MDTDEDDYFGIKSVQNTPVPKHLLKPKSSEFFDVAFFPGMAEEDVEHLEKAEDLQPDNIFEEQYFAGMSQSGAGDVHSLLLQHDQQAKRAQQGPATVVGQDVASDGLDELVEAIEPVWAYSHEQRVQMMTQRVIYETEDLIAVDKPYQMAYSGANKDQAQLDRLLQDIRKVVTTDCDRLHVIASLDKCCSGVVLFAKNAKKQAELRGFLKDGLNSTLLKNCSRGLWAKITHAERHGFTSKSDVSSS